MFDTIYRAVRAENGILNLVKNMWVDRLWSQTDFMPLGSFSLNVVLPKVALLLARRRTGSCFTSAFLVTASRIC